MKRSSGVVPAAYGARRYKRLKEAKFPHEIRALPHVIERIDLFPMSAEDAAVEAAATNQILWLQRLLPLVTDQVKDQVGCDATDIAAAHGHCEAIKLVYRWWVQPAGYSKPTQLCSRALVNAVGGGHLQTVKTLLGQWDDFFDGDRSAFENAFTVPKPCYKFDILKALDLAVKNKNTEVVRVLCDESGVRGEIMKWAAEHGYLDVLQVVYRFEEDFVEDLYRAMIIAVERGFLEIVKFLTTECGEGLIAFAADEFGFCCPVISAIEHGNIEVMEYLETQNMFLDETFVPVFCAAAAHGPLDVVRTFYEREELDDTALDGAFASAAGKSQLEILTYLQTKRKFDHVAINEALNAAANNGHLDAVKYLCGIEDYEISAAALDAAFECAAEVWHLEMVKFLDGKGKVSRASVNTAFVNAMNEPNCYRGEIDDQLEIFKFLYSKGCIYTDIIQDDFVDFARSCHVDVVEFVYSKISTSISCKMVEKAFKKATCENSTEVAK